MRYFCFQKMCGIAVLRQVFSSFFVCFSLFKLSAYYREQFLSMLLNYTSKDQRRVTETQIMMHLSYLSFHTKLLSTE